MHEIPLLNPVDVELRVAQLQETSYGVYVTLLVYKNARVDMKLLDQVVGPKNWKREHQLIGDKMFCTVSVYDPDKCEWIPKQDVGVESNTEAVKGMVSDSFKRACFCWGIGRELYNAPDIRFKLNDNEVTSSSYGKAKTYAKFHVGSMVYDADLGCFTEFTVLDENNNIRFSLDKAIKKDIPSRNDFISKKTEAQAIPQSPINEPLSQYDNRPVIGGNICSECGLEVKSPKVAEFAMKRFGRILCYNCQKKLG